MKSNVVEREYVEECPCCGTKFLGATPEDIREHCRTECNPLGQLVVFPAKASSSVETNRPLSSKQTEASHV